MMYMALASLLVLSACSPTDVAPSGDPKGTLDQELSQQQQNDDNEIPTPPPLPD